MNIIDDEKKLIKQVQKGSDQAFKKLYNIYAEYALRTVYAITRNQNHTSDIVQETFIKVYRNIHQFHPKKPFKPWFYQILLNESRRYMKQQNKQATSVDSEQLLDYSNSNYETTPNFSLLENSLDQLSYMHRTILTLKYINEFTEKEIAHLLHLNVNTVKSRLFKARRKLKEIIGGVKHVQ